MSRRVRPTLGRHALATLSMDDLVGCRRTRGAHVCARMRSTPVARLVIHYMIPAAAAADRHTPACA
ncbi:hypothetical protein EON67_04065 [archaeon]|nr:MAG: hypothetical protein EON67_04065 [archaeon]